MCASGIVYANYKSAIDQFEGGAGIRTVPGYSENATAGIFCTYPAAFLTKTGQFFSEFIASALLMFLIYALKDDGNIGAGPLTPLGLFFIIFGIGACFGWETGYAINLARDFGPRLMSYFLGYVCKHYRASTDLRRLAGGQECVSRGYIIHYCGLYSWTTLLTCLCVGPHISTAIPLSLKMQLPMLTSNFRDTTSGLLAITTSVSQHQYS